MATVIAITVLPGFQVAQDPYKLNRILGTIGEKDGRCYTNPKCTCPCKDYINRGICHCGLYVPIMHCSPRASASV